MFTALIRASRTWPAIADRRVGLAVLGAVRLDELDPLEALVDGAGELAERVLRVVEVDRHLFWYTTLRIMRIGNIDTATRPITASV